MVEETSNNSVSILLFVFFLWNCFIWLSKNTNIKKKVIRNPLIYSDVVDIVHFGFSTCDKHHKLGLQLEEP